MADPMNFEQASKTQKYCLCSDCWGHLVVDRQPGQQDYTVHCMTTDCPCNGFVSKRYVEQQESKSHGEAVEARVALRRAWTPNPNDRKALSNLRRNS